jgi:Mycotoxin biosynthesis protein UstYa
LWEDHHYRKYPELFPEHIAKMKELPEVMEHHYEHCVDSIRQRLMCTADDAVVTFRWVKDVPGPYPFFNTNHVCHDYEAMLGWTQARAANKAAIANYNFEKPANVVELSRAP